MKDTIASDKGRSGKWWVINQSWPVYAERGPQHSRQPCGNRRLRLSHTMQVWEQTSSWGVEPTVGPQCDPRRTQPRAFVFLAVVFLFMSNCHVSWIGSRNPCAQAHDGGLRRGPAGDCEMPLWYGSRCRPNNLREGAMVPLHGTCLLEVRAPVGRQDSGGLILSYWPSTPVTSQYSPLRLFTPRARRSCQLG